MKKETLFRLLAWFFVFENGLVVFLSLISEPMQLIRATLTFISMIVFIYFASFKEAEK